MSAATKTAEIDYVRTAMGLYRQKKIGEALAVAEQAAREYPTYVLPHVGGTFGELVKQLRGSLPEPQEETQAPAPVVETRTLRLTHTAQSGTSIFGVEKASAAHRILGKEGFKLGFYPATAAWYIRRSKGDAADLAKIAEIVKALESAREPGSDVPLYRVDQSIDTVAPKVDKAARAVWQREYEHRMNAAQWNQTFGKAACVTCPAAGLDLHTSEITRDEENLPRVQCKTCAGAPGVDLSALARELGSEPAPLPESAECPACRTRQPIVDGQLKVHSKPFTGGFCRGKAPVADVEPEPKAAPVRKPAPRKATTARKAESAKPARPVDTSDLQAELMGALAAGDTEAATAVFLKMAERAEAAKREAESAKPEPTGALAEIGTAWKFATVDGISGTTLKNSATSARSDLPRAFRKAGWKVQTKTEQGLKVEIRRDRDAKCLVATVTDLPADNTVSASKLAKIVRSIVTSQRGVVSATRV